MLYIYNVVIQRIKGRFYSFGPKFMWLLQFLSELQRKEISSSDFLSFIYWYFSYIFKFLCLSLAQVIGGACYEFPVGDHFSLIASIWKKLGRKIMKKRWILWSICQHLVEKINFWLNSNDLNTKSNKQINKKKTSVKFTFKTLKRALSLERW